MLSYYSWFEGIISGVGQGNIDHSFVTVFPDELFRFSETTGIQRKLPFFHVYIYRELYISGMAIRIRDPESAGFSQIIRNPESAISGPNSDSNFFLNINI